MALKICAARNNLGTSDSPYYALAKWSDVIENEAFIDRMAAGRTTISKTEILAVFQLAREELTRLLADGCYVKTPFGSAIPVAIGKLDSPTSSFSPAKSGSGHGLRFDFRIDPKIESEALSYLCIERSEGADILSPRIVSFASVQSEQEGKARAGDVLKIIGRQLKFNQADLSLGLFVRSIDGREWRASMYAQVKPSSLIAGLPLEVPPGDYSLVIRTLSRGGTRLEGISQTKLGIIGA